MRRNTPYVQARVRTEYEAVSLKESLYVVGSIIVIAAGLVEVA